MHPSVLGFFENHYSLYQIALVLTLLLWIPAVVDVPYHIHIDRDYGSNFKATKCTWW